MKNISLKAKILFLSVFMVGASVLIGAVSSIYSQKTNATFHALVDSDLPALRAVTNMLLAFRFARIELLSLQANGTTAEADAQSKKIIEEQWKIFDENNKAYLDVSNNAPENEKKLYDNFQKEYTTARELFTKAIALYDKNPTEGSAERNEMSKLTVIELPIIAARLRDVTKEFTDLQAQQIAESSQVAFKASETGTLISVLVTVICALVSLSVSFIFSTKLARQMDHVITSISSSSREVAAASNQIAKSSEELSQASTEQAASLGQTAASLEEITAMIAKASESASSTERSSSASQAKAEEGRRAVDQMLSSIEEISQSNEQIVGQVSHSNQQMAEIVRVIQEIGTKTKVINEIVFQTKLLSFNASVEAARAGEHGKGFAVVAEEVGNLAQMSGNAAKEISDMLDGSISKVESIVKESKTKVEALVQSGKQKVEVGVDVARQCSTVLDEIVSNVTQVTSLSLEISQASREQAQGVGEINKAMSQLDSVTQQNSSTSEQTASAAEQLSAQAVSLKSAVDDLVVVIRGGVSNHEAKVQVPATKHSKPAVVNKKTQEVKEHKPVVAKKEQKHSNVIPLKAAKKKVPAQVELVHSSPREFKMAAGESTTPSRDSDGFDE